MDFAQGIDSDIEEVVTTTSGPIISHGQMDRTHTIDDDDDMGGVPLPKDDGWVFFTRSFIKYNRMLGYNFIYHTHTVIFGQITLTIGILYYMLGFISRRVTKKVDNLLYYIHILPVR